jgi:hypothetical protein
MWLGVCGSNKRAFLGIEIVLLDHLQLGYFTDTAESAENYIRQSGADKHR